LAPSADQVGSDDFSLMEGIRRADASSLRALYQRYASLIMALGLRMLKERSDAEDLLIDVFEEVWEKRDRFDASRGSPKTYLITLARSRAIDRRRQRNRHSHSPPSPIDPQEPSPSPSATLSMAEDRLRVRQALEMLSAEQREAIECSFYEGLSHVEIAGKLQKPLGTVKTYIRQGLMRVRDALRKEFSEE
jgi:RNA polymerase sigma-70 factor (ECF subfamily)